MVKIILRVKRYNPEDNKGPYFQNYDLEVEREDRILDCLMQIVNYQDSSLALRKSCAHGVCGSDAMIINGKERLACKTLVMDLFDNEDAEEKPPVITCEPLKGLPVEKDLIVDQDKFFTAYKSVKPFLINNEPAPQNKERIQSAQEREKIDDPTKCILCAACYSSCPISSDSNPDFIGPAALVQAARFVFDTRDKAFAERIKILDRENGVWGCENHFNCTKVCPREIKVTKNINLTKRKIKQYKGTQL